MAFQPLPKKQPRVAMDEEDLALPAGPPRAADSDLCCMEDGWDKDSPSRGAAPAAPAAASAAAAAMPRVARPAGARLPTPSERAQLRRARPAAGENSGAAAAAAARAPFLRQPIPPSPGDGGDSLVKMLRAQKKFLPAGVTGAGASRARCHRVSPFVAERRGLFVAWEVGLGCLRFFSHLFSFVCVCCGGT